MPVQVAADVYHLIKLKLSACWRAIAILYSGQCYIMIRVVLQPPDKSAALWREISFETAFFAEKTRKKKKKFPTTTISDQFFRLIS